MFKSISDLIQYRRQLIRHGPEWETIPILWDQAARIYSEKIVSLMMEKDPDGPVYPTISFMTVMNAADDVMRKRLSADFKLTVIILSGYVSNTFCDRIAYAKTVLADLHCCYVLAAYGWPNILENVDDAPTSACFAYKYRGYRENSVCPEESEAKAFLGPDTLTGFYFGFSNRLIIIAFCCIFSVSMLWVSNC
jgi:hypothetical protein